MEQLINNLLMHLSEYLSITKVRFNKRSKMIQPDKDGENFFEFFHCVLRIDIFTIFVQ